MSDTFYIKQNDTSPSLRATLQDANGNPVDVTGASVQFHMRSSGSVIVDAVASIVTPASGIVEYSWAPADTATVGSYQAEFEVTYASGAVETFPNTGYIRVRIRDDIA